MGSETKAEKFVRLAESRVNRAIKDIRSIGNLSNRSNYSYDEEQVGKVIRALKQEVAALQRRFDDASTSSDGPFRL